MKQIRWSISKSDRLKALRGVSFEELLNRGRLISVKEHPNRPDQSIMLFEFQKYIWVVQFVEDEQQIFLKTLYPSRKYTKMYKAGG